MRTRLLLLAGQTVSLGLMMAFLVVPVSAVFLDEYGAAALAYVYIAVAVAGVTVSAAMTSLERRVSLASMAAATWSTYLVIVLAGWVVLSLDDAVWVTFPLLVMFPLSIPIGFALVGAQAGRLLDVRQMKAHFPRVASGFSVGFALGGLAAAGLVGPLGGPEPLLAVDLLAVGLMIVLVLETGRRHSTELRSPPSAPAPRRTTRVDPERSRLFANRLIVMIFGYQVLSAAVTQLLDYMVWERAAARYPDPSDLARFQGLFGAVINIGSVLFVVTVAGWLLTRFGIGLGLLANPAAVLVLLVATTVTGVVDGPASLVFFVLICAQQVTDISLTDGTTRTSINATYQALLPQDRLRAQTTIEGAGVPLALGFVGLLLILQDALALDIRAVVAFTVALGVLWSLFALLAYREYGKSLRDVLAHRAWDPVALRMDDEASMTAVRSLLRSGDLHDAETALDALVDANSPELPVHVAALLESSDPERRRLGAATAGAADLLTDETVLAAVEALRADPEPRVALTAAAVLVGRDEQSRLTWLAATRREGPAAEAALEAAARTPDAFFVPYLVELAAWPAVPTGLVDALVAHADHLLPIAARMWEQRVPTLTRTRVLLALGEADADGARALLLDHLDDEDPAVVEAAARALLSAGHRAEPGGTALTAALRRNGVRAAACLQVLLLLPDDQGSAPLCAALRDEVLLAGQRMAVLLSLGYDPAVVAAGVRGLQSAVERERSTALEMLEVSLGRRAAGHLRATLGSGPDDEARLRLLAEHALPERTLREWLRELVLDDEGYWHEPWLQACALYALPGLLEAEAHTLARGGEASPDPVVAETARWVLDWSFGGLSP